MPDLTLLAAFVAGVISFLSPCVLPVVPAYLGQLGIVATSRPLAAASPLVPAGMTASGAAVAAPSRMTGWRALPNAIAFVLGFTAVFTVVGMVIYQASGPLRDNLPLLRQIGGIVPAAEREEVVPVGVHGM